MARPQITLHRPQRRDALRPPLGHQGGAGAASGHTFSFYHRSRLDFTRADGTKVDCEDLRAGCAALSGDDGYPGEYAYATIDRSPDSG